MHQVEIVSPADHNKSMDSTRSSPWCPLYLEKRGMLGCWSFMETSKVSETLKIDVYRWRLIELLNLKEKFEYRLITLQTNANQSLVYMDRYSVLQRETTSAGEASNYSSQPSNKRRYTTRPARFRRLLVTQVIYHSPQSLKRPSRTAG